MGTVLHQKFAITKQTLADRFSPLLDGDGVASSPRPLWKGLFLTVSVPFSMGTVLHPFGGADSLMVNLRFSPLLDGDGVASRTSR